MELSLKLIPGACFECNGDIMAEETWEGEYLYCLRCGQHLAGIEPDPVLDGRTESQSQEGKSAIYGLSSARQ